MLLLHTSFSAEKGSRSKSPAPSLVATINGHTIRVQFVFGRFDPKKRVVTKRIEKPDVGQTYEQILVNGKPVLGLDNDDPTRGTGDKDEPRPFKTIEKILLHWDGKRVAVPSSLYDHIVMPGTDTSLRDGEQPDVMFVPDPAGEALVVTMRVGDGGGTNRIIWLLRKDGKHRILKDEFFELSL